MGRVCERRIVRVYAAEGAAAAQAVRDLVVAPTAACHCVLTASGTAPLQHRLLHPRPCDGDTQGHVRGDALLTHMARLAPTPRHASFRHASFRHARCRHACFRSAMLRAVEDCRRAANPPAKPAKGSACCAGGERSHEMPLSCCCHCCHARAARAQGVQRCVALCSRALVLAPEPGRRLTCVVHGGPHHECWVMRWEHVTQAGPPF